MSSLTMLIAFAPLFLPNHTDEEANDFEEPKGYLYPLELFDIVEE